MIKFYAILGLFSIAQVNATEAETMGMNHSDHHFKHSGKSSSVTKYREVESLHSSNSISFDDFSGDPYDLEEKYLSLSKSGNFKEAAVALAGSAINGNSENLDYLLKIDQNAIKYIKNKDNYKTAEIISKISKELEKQRKLYQ